LCSPLVATQFAQLPRWSFHYLCSVGVALINTIGLIAVFRFKTQDGVYHGNISVRTDKSFLTPKTAACLAEIGQEPEEKGASEDSHFRQIFSLRALHILAIFTLVYVGVEVTIGGK
jgi:hypothetical protein